MEFKRWLKLQEAGTSTSDVAVFSRISIPLIRRCFVFPWGEEDQDDFFKKDKTKKKKKD